MINKSAIRQAAVRLFTTRYLLGMFGETEYDEIPNNSITTVGENGNYIVQGADGVTTLFDSKGSVVQKRRTGEFYL